MRRHDLKGQVPVVALAFRRADVGAEILGV